MPRDAPAPVDNLRALLAALSADEPIPPHVRAWAAAGIAEYLHRARDGLSLADALGLSTPQSAEPWWRAEGRIRRDAELRLLADRFLPGRTISEQATEISKIGNRYAAAAWRFDRRRDDLPPGYAGTPREHLFHALKATGRIPKERQLRSILRSEKSAFGNEPPGLIAKGRR